MGLALCCPFCAAANFQAGVAPQRDSASPESLAAALAQAVARGENQRASELLGQLLERPQLDADLLLRVGIELAQRELYAGAARAFARCAQEHPQVFEAHYNLGLAEFAEQDFTSALAALDAAPHGSQPQQLARLYLRGKIENALGKPDDAERDLAAAFSGDPRQENYALDLGLFYLRRRAYPRAAEVFEGGASFHPRSPYLALGLALAQFLGGHEPESIETSKKLLQVAPDFSAARLLMAFALYMGGKLDEAEKIAAQGLAARQPPAYLYYLHATLALKRQSKDYDRILDELALAHRGIPACSLCSLAESKAHQAEGDRDKAIADLETAVRFDPAFADAWYRLAPLYQRAGRAADAAHARAEFQRLKANQENRETEMLRGVFLETLGSEPGSSPKP